MVVCLRHTHTHTQLHIITPASGPVQHIGHRAAPLVQFGVKDLAQGHLTDFSDGGVNAGILLLHPDSS